MPVSPPVYRPKGMHAREVKLERGRDHDRQRRQLKPWRRLYKLKAWIEGRLEHLAQEPLCRRCKQRDHLRAATIVNHVIPHRGDEELFFDRSNWESLCAPCHDGAVQQYERLGYVTDVDASGRYVDPMHPSNLP